MYDMELGMAASFQPGHGEWRAGDLGGIHRSSAGSEEHEHHLCSLDSVKRPDTGSTHGWRLGTDEEAGGRNLSPTQEGQPTIPKPIHQISCEAIPPEEETAQAGREASVDEDCTGPWGDVTRGKLHPQKVNEAREDIRYFNKMRVYEKVPTKVCKQRTGKMPIPVRWVDVNKRGPTVPQLQVQVGGQGHPQGCSTGLIRWNSTLRSIEGRTCSGSGEP